MWDIWCSIVVWEGLWLPFGLWFLGVAVIFLVGVVGKGHISPWYGPMG